jgi:hypothetical protein
MRWRGKRTGLVLGGGGVRGFSHIGVLKILEREDISLNVIVGSSARTLIGGTYASGASPGEIERRVDTYLNSPEFKSSSLRSISLTMSPYDRTAWEKIQKFTTHRYYTIRGLFKPAVVSVKDLQSLVNYFIPDKEILINVNQYRRSYGEECIWNETWVPLAGSSGSWWRFFYRSQCRGLGNGHCVSRPRRPCRHASFKRSIRTLPALCDAGN